jgi:DNA-binding transcriptional LysR family regulator
LDNIDIRLLRVFVALSDAPGFADAELVLNPSQSTLSTHLAGQAIYDAAQKLFLDLGEFSRRVGSATGSLAGRLRHGASEGTFTCRSLGLQHIIRQFDGL